MIKNLRKNSHLAWAWAWLMCPFSISSDTAQKLNHFTKIPAVGDVVCIG